MYGYESWIIKKGWALKNWCFWIVGLEKTPENPLDSKEIKPVNPKGNQPWVFIGRNDAETETPVFGYLVRRTDSLEKTLILRKTEGRRRRGQQRMRAGWYHRLDGRGFKQAPCTSLVAQMVKKLPAMRGHFIGIYWELSSKNQMEILHQQISINRK